MGQHQPYASCTCCPPSAMCPETLDMEWGCASTAAGTDPAPSTALAKPAPCLPTFKPRSLWVSYMERPGNAMSIAMPPGILKLVISSPPKPDLLIQLGFPFKTQAGCATWLLSAHMALCSLGATQQTTTVWREKHHCEASRETQGTQHLGCPRQPRALLNNTLVGRGVNSPVEGHLPGTCCSRLDCCWADGFVQRDSPRLQPTSTAQMTQPCKTTDRQPSTPWDTIPGLKNGKKISLTSSRSGSEQERPTLSAGTHQVPAAPSTAGNST